MNTLNSQVRSQVGKNTSHKVREEGFIPSVIYGRDMNTLPVQIDRRDVESLLRNGDTNALITLNIGGQPYTALIKEMQVNPITKEVIHIDFQKVSQDQKIIARVPIVLSGKQYVERGNVTLQQQMREVEVQCFAGNIPKKLEFDISTFKPGDTLKVADMEYSAEFHIVHDPNTVIASVTVGQSIVDATEEV